MGRMIRDIIAALEAGDHATAHAAIAGQYGVDDSFSENDVATRIRASFGAGRTERREALVDCVVNIWTATRPDGADWQRAAAPACARTAARLAVDGMSEIVQELAKRNWTDARIARELGMDPDEVLRLKQITGLAELFSDREFSEAWE